MKFFRNAILKFIYGDVTRLVEIEFGNRTKVAKKVWVELSCQEFEIEPETEYKIVTHDKAFRIEFDSEDSIIFYLQYTFGFKLYKRAISKEIRNPLSWELEFDLSEIN